MKLYYIFALNNVQKLCAINIKENNQDHVDSKSGNEISPRLHLILQVKTQRHTKMSRQGEMLSWVYTCKLMIIVSQPNLNEGFSNAQLV